MQVIVLLS